jgi:signal transduction histidine kinase
MRLAARFTLVHVLLLAIVWGGFGSYEVQRERGLFDEDMVRDHRSIAAAVAAALQDRSGDDLELGRVRVSLRPGDEVRTRATAEQRAELDQTGETSFYAPEVHEHVTWRTVPDGRVVQVSEVDDVEQAFVRRSAVLTGEVIGLLLILLGVSAGVAGWWLIGSPIERLSRQAEAVGAGECAGRLGWRRADELGDLAVATDRMSERLAALVRNLEAETASRARAEAQLRHADRLATVGTLAAGVAHELGTPLNVIAVRAEMIGDAEGVPDAVRDGARIVGEQADRITAILEQLLEFARPSKPRMADLDPAALLREVAALLGPVAAKARGRLVVLPGEAGLVVRADRGLLQQALLNLVMNGIQAGPGGDVELGADRVEAARPDDPAGAVRRWVRLTVRDHGGGVPLEVRDHLFEPFFTTKPPGEGTGLGLSVTWGIVRDHGGFLAFEDAGPGARFALHLPDPAEAA